MTLSVTEIYLHPIKAHGVEALKSVNPETGERDVNTLDALKNGWDHRDFGVKAFVLQGGTFNINDLVEIL